MKLVFAQRLVAAILLRLLGFSCARRGKEEWNKCAIGLLVSSYLPRVFLSRMELPAKQQVFWVHFLTRLLDLPVSMPRFSLVGFAMLLVLLVVFIDLLLDQGKAMIAKVNKKSSTSHYWPWNP